MRRDQGEEGTGHRGGWLAGSDAHGSGSRLLAESFRGHGQEVHCRRYVPWLRDMRARVPGGQHPDDRRQAELAPPLRTVPGLSSVVPGGSDPGRHEDRGAHALPPSGDTSQRPHAVLVYIPPSCELECCCGNGRDGLAGALAWGRIHGVSVQLPGWRSAADIGMPRCQLGRQPGFWMGTTVRGGCQGLGRSRVGGGASGGALAGGHAARRRDARRRGRASSRGDRGGGRLRGLAG